MDTRRLSTADVLLSGVLNRPPPNDGQMVCTGTSTKRIAVTKLSDLTMDWRP